MSHSDSTFFKPFAFVLGALIIFTLFIGFIANIMSPDSADDPLAAAQLKQTIAPVGQSRVAVDEAAAQPSGSDAGSGAVATEAEAAATEASEEPAEEMATEESSASDTDTDTTAAVEEQPEASGDAAPDNAEAAGSESADVAAVTAVAATTGAVGDISMKVKAKVATNCAGCHDEGLDGAAKTDDAEAWNALAAKGIDTLTASVVNGKGKMPARAESSLDDTEIRQAVQLMINNATGGSGAAAATAAPAVSEETKVTNEATAEATQVAVAAPTEVPAEVKGIVDSVCAACHTTGLINAPKFGDAAAWEPRIAKGIDALTASAIAGIGAMPARGGSALDDEQMKLAIEYMISK